MALRAGRGAHILKILEEKKRSRAEEGAQDNDGGAHQSAEQPAAPQPQPKSRAALMEQLRMAQARAAAAPAPAKATHPVDVVSNDSGFVVVQPDATTGSTQ